jgi:hypothetical protein
MEVILFYIVFGYFSWMMLQDSKTRTQAYLAYYNKVEEDK